MPTITLRLPAYSDHKYRVSWLRSGYLAAYAALGYSYIYRSQLDAVRYQIDNAHERHLQYFHGDLGDNWKGQRAIAIILDPEWASGVAVQWEQHLIFLPLNDDASAYYERLKSKDGTSVKLQGKALDWPPSPTGAQFYLDFI